MTSQSPEYYHGLDRSAIMQSVIDHLLFTLAKDQYTVTDVDRYTAVALSVRDRLIERFECFRCFTRLLGEQSCPDGEDTEAEQCGFHGVAPESSTFASRCCPCRHTPCPRRR